MKNLLKAKLRIDKQKMSDMKTIGMCVNDGGDRVK